MTNYRCIDHMPIGAVEGQGLTLGTKSECEDSSHAGVQYLSMPDPEGTTRLDIIRERLS